MSKHNYIPIILAIILLFFLIYINKYFKENFSVSDASNLSSVLFKDIGAESIITDVKSLEMKDDNIVYILNSGISDSEKVIKLKAYICNLVDIRNDNPEYSNIPPSNKLNCKDFVKILEIVGSKDMEYNVDYTSKITDLKGLMLNDIPYSTVINSSASDKDKFIGPLIPNITSLTTDIINKTLTK